MLFGKPGGERGLLTVGPDPGDVFVANRRDQLARWFVPMVSVTGSSIAPQLGAVRFHFIYHELSGDSNCARFRIHSDGYEYLGDFSECNKHVSLPELVTWNHRHGDLVPIEVPPRPSTAEVHTWWFSVVREHCTSIDPSLSQLFFFGGDEPNWNQEDETPLAPDGSRMLFVGQVSAEVVSPNFGSTVAYLFFDPRSATVAQVTQPY